MTVGKDIQTRKGDYLVRRVEVSDIAIGFVYGVSSKVKNESFVTIDFGVVTSPTIFVVSSEYLMGFLGFDDTNSRSF